MSPLRSSPLLALLGALVAGAAGAQGLEVSPIRVSLSHTSTTATLHLRNGGSEPRRYQLSAHAWSQGADGQVQLAPTQEVVFFPPLVTLEAGEERNVRLAARVPPGPIEKTYRLFVEELPDGRKPDPGQVRVLTRLSIPVFLVPERPVATARIDALAAEGRKLSFALANTGNVHVRPLTVRAEARGARREVLFAQDWSGWYVLAGDKRVYQAEVPREACAQVRSLTIQVSSEDQKPLEHSVETPRGVCGG